MLLSGILTQAQTTCSKIFGRATVHGQDSSYSDGLGGCPHDQRSHAQVPVKSKFSLSSFKTETCCTGHICEAVSLVEIMSTFDIMVDCGNPCSIASLGYNDVL